MTVAKGQALPLSLAPRGLSRQQAAEYVGLSASSFDQLVATRLMPKPKRIGGRVIWDRLAVDEAFSALDSDDPSAGQWGSLDLSLKGGRSAGTPAGSSEPITSRQSVASPAPRPSPGRD